MSNSVSEKNTTSVSESYSDTDSSSDYESNTSSSSNNDYRYLKRGRIINGVESQFENLPTPNSLLFCDFFKEFTVKPNDFNEETAIYFKSGIN